MPQPFDSAQHPHHKYQATDLELARLCKTFDIGRWSAVERDLGGMLNTSLLIRTSEGQYVVRIHSAYAKSKYLDYAYEVQKTLREAELPVALPLKTTEGNVYTKFGERKVQVTQYVDALTYSFRRRQIYTSGKMQRKFHRALKRVEQGPMPEWSNYYSSAVMRRGLSALKRLQPDISSEQWQTVNRFYNIVMDKWQHIDRSSLPKTIIHGDWHLWNQLYTPEGDVCCILDFDSLQRRERIYDVAYTLWALFTQRRGYKAAEFLRGYKYITDEENHLLPKVMARISLFNLCSASLLNHPLDWFQESYELQASLLPWMLSNEGKRVIRNLRYQ